jgi:hypothetical protein
MIVFFLKHSESKIVRICGTFFDFLRIKKNETFPHTSFHADDNLD